MGEWPAYDSTEAVRERRDKVVDAVVDHAGGIARELAVLRGGDYGRETFDTGRGTWTLKYEGGDLEYLRFEGQGSEPVYVVSTKQPPEPEPLARAMADYDAFLDAYDAHVEALDGVLDGVSTEFPAVTSTEAAVAERDRVLDAVRATCDRIAGELHRYDGEYGTYATRVEGTRWELKWEGDTASYLRVGGEGGVYLLSQYQAPSAADVRELATEFPAFVDAFNAHVDDLEADLSHVSL